MKYFIPKMSILDKEFFEYSIEDKEGHCIKNTGFMCGQNVCISRCAKKFYLKYRKQKKESQND